MQAALLEAMGEKQVTIGQTTFKLEKPFLVLATQNPVDQEGTYPLPEAQVDRFMMKVTVGYPDKASEKEIMKRMSNMTFSSKVETVITRDDIFAIRDLINEVQMSEAIEDYIVDIVFATREPKQYGLKREAEYIQFGVSPRATIGLNLGAKANAFIKGRDYVLPEDVKDIVADVISHRLILNYEAEADGVTKQDIVDSILKAITVN